jgi:aspartate/methionine/tyrosine aminotransferase
MMQSKYYTKRISDMPTSIFSTMSKMALEYNAVNLGQGFPDFDGPSWLMEKAFEAMKAGKNQYAPSMGTLSLRQEVHKQYKKQYDLDFDPDKEITVTAGATEALFSTINALVQEDEEVIMFEPFYDAYQADVMLLVELQFTSRSKSPISILIQRILNERSTAIQR